MKQILLLLTMTFGVQDLGFAQILKDLVTTKSQIVGLQSLKSKAYLFIQEDCEACEASLLRLAKCSLAIRSRISLVVLESETWAMKKIKSPGIERIHFLSLNFMTREEAQKINVRGTPTYLIGQISELKPLSCREIKKLLTDQQSLLQ
jgi:hypothetical protein